MSVKLLLYLVFMAVAVLVALLVAFFCFVLIYSSAN